MDGWLADGWLVSFGGRSVSQLWSVIGLFVCFFVFNFFIVALLEVSLLTVSTVGWLNVV